MPTPMPKILARFLSPAVLRPLRWNAYITISTTLLGLGALAFTLFLAIPLFLGTLYTEDDLGAFHLPLRHFYATALQDGHSFLWMPHIFNGFYLLSEGQIGLFHPWHLFLYRFLPLNTAFTLELWISYPLLLLGWYTFLRRWNITPHSALFAALLGTFMGFPMNHYIHMHFIAILAHLPWALLAIDHWLMPDTDRPPPRAWLALLLLSTSQILLAMPQAILFTWLIEGAYAIMLLNLGRRVIPFLHLGTAKVLAILLGAIQLVPLWEGLQNSYRAAPQAGFNLSISLHPLNLLQLINPYLFHRRVFAPFKGDEPWDAPYLGAATLALVLLIILRIPKLNPRERTLTLFGAGIALPGFMLALGHYGFLDPILTHTPILNKLRAPARFIALAHTGLLLITAVALTHLHRLHQEETKLRSSLLGPGIVILAALGTLLYAVLHHSGHTLPLSSFIGHQLMPTPNIALGTALVCTAALLVIIAGRGHAWAIPLLILLALADMGLYSLRHKEHMTRDQYLAQAPPPPQATPGTRIDPDIHPTTMNRYAFYDLQAPFGYTALMPHRALDYTLETPLRLAGVQWRKTRELASPEVANAFAQGKDWVPLDQTLPRIRVVSNATPSTDPATDLTTIDPATTVLTDTLTYQHNGPMATPEIKEQHPGHYTIQTTQGGGILVIAENFHPGWHATHNNTPIPIHTAYGDFICLQLPDTPGEIILNFQPHSLRQGQYMTALALLLTLLYFATLAYRHHKY